MIQLHQKSLEYLQGIFSVYKSVEKLPIDINGRVIFHLYAVEDTYNSEGGLVGYEDSLLFRVDIYLWDTKIKYSTGLNDNIEFFFPVKARIFKDGSTMFMVDVTKGSRLDIYQSYRTVIVDMVNK